MQWRWYVYVLECRDGLYYTGMTWNPQNRIVQHPSGKGSRFTARHGVKSLRFLEEFDNLYEARRREIEIKDFSRKKKEAIFSTNIVLASLEQ